MSGVEHLRLLASAIAGRTVDVAAAPQGERSWTDGATVFLARGADRAEEVRMLTVQASLLAAGSLAPGVVRQLARRPGLARRYLAIESQRALAAGADLLPPAARSLVDHGLAALATSPDEALVLARRADTAIPHPSPTFGTIHPRRVLAVSEPAEPTPARAPGTDAPPLDAEPLADLDDDRDDETGPGLGQLLSSPVGGGGPVGRLLRRLLHPARAPGGGGPPGGDAPTHLARSRPGTANAGVTIGNRVQALGTVPPLEPRGTSYPEWDTYRRRYRPEWCTVVEADAPRGQWSTPMVDQLGLRGPLARLGVDLIRCRRQPHGDGIDIDAAVEARVDSLAGQPHDDDFYVASLRRRRDLAVLVLLDVSGSAGEPGTAGRSVHQHQQLAAASLTVALHELGDRVALYAFNSRGRTAVHVLRVKAFGDRLDGHAAQRLDGLVPAAYTRLGAAMRHGTSILETRSGTPRRLLVVISDGFAYDHGYEGRYGEADARRALVEARRRGVGCLCLSIAAGTDPAALRRVFGAAAHAAVPSAEQLAGIIGPLFRTALQSAEAQRRAHQRTERARERLAIERRTHDRSGPAVLHARR